jgi:hypothetical protein
MRSRLGVDGAVATGVNGPSRRRVTTVPLAFWQRTRMLRQLIYRFMRPRISDNTCSGCACSARHGAGRCARTCKGGRLPAQPLHVAVLFGCAHPRHAPLVFLRVLLQRVLLQHNAASRLLRVAWADAIFLPRHHGVGDPPGPFCSTTYVAPRSHAAARRPGWAPRCRGITSRREPGAGGGDYALHAYYTVLAGSIAGMPARIAARTGPRATEHIPGRAPRPPRVSRLFPPAPPPPRPNRCVRALRRARAGSGAPRCVQRTDLRALFVGAAALCRRLRAWQRACIRARSAQRGRALRASDHSGSLARGARSRAR